LGIVGLFLLVFYQNADLVGSKPLVFPGFLASIHKDQMAAKNSRVDPESYLKNVYDRSPASTSIGTIGRILHDDPPPSECKLSDPNGSCSSKDHYEDKTDIDVGMDPMSQRARLKVGAAFETTMKSWNNDPTWGIKKDLSPNSCLNVEMNQNGNQGKVLFDLRF
jgi:hypothetical protein